MDQYFPAHKTLDDPLLGRKITPEEYDAAIEAFEAAGLVNGWMQEHEASLDASLHDDALESFGSRWYTTG